jgi:hypothetical protein
MAFVKPGSAMMNGESLWSPLAGLALIVEGATTAFTRCSLTSSSATPRRSGSSALAPTARRGCLGVPQGRHRAARDSPLEGEWTLASFCDHLAALELWPEPPAWDGARRFRKLGVRVRGADLAAPGRRSLHDVLRLTPQPVRFVNSLGQEPFDRTSPAPRCSLQARRGGRPGAGARRGGRATGAVDTIDLKGQYGFEVKDPEALAALYDQVLAAFPDAYLEDPHDLPEIKQRLGDHLDRVSQDAPIRDVENIGTTPLAPRIVNVKPSRIGSLRRLFGVYARCARERRPTYWRWHGRAGRGPRADRAACRFVPRRCANDVAPSAYNETTRRAACRPARWRRAPGLLALLGGIGAHTARAAHTVRMCDRGGR